ncbi:putative vacuolar fusion protein Mon1p [[Candida] jaroonii]|uniref:Vacuolar fusion protein Mon1p n=1 Tax=[Candida] jaroonii TaxID=467808 RepID=A0ACA9Y1U3_9ASCO|nr:putative vacuolar fusion protein Mon1p [[Candida] jaroonii]
MLPRLTVSTQAVTNYTAGLPENDLSIQTTVSNSDLSDLAFNGVAKVNNTHFQSLDIFPKDNSSEDEYLDKFVYPGKDLNNNQFNDKLKQFFILSSSGKPIYSLNGGDELIIGFTGLITTIISSFQHQLNEDIVVIDSGDVKISVLNRDPLILVSISKINYEMSMNQITNDYQQLKNQLHSLYNYLLCILSRPTITKSFQNRMNYDLRKMLTDVDFKNLDDMAMKLTYGLSGDSDNDDSFEFFLSQLVNGFPTSKISYTIRSKLNSLLLHHRIDEILFGLLTSNLRRIITMIKPKVHNISNSDIDFLLRIIKNNNKNIKDIETEDLWIPICLPEFNSNGFVYVYVKTFDLAKILVIDGKYYEDSQLINIVLISTNKNNFFKVKEMANKIIENIIQLELKDKLYQELSNYTINLPPTINHFVYRDLKHKDLKQCLISNNPKDCNSIIKYVYYYSNLYNSKSSTIQSLTQESGNRKLSYIKYDVITFSIIDDNYEFYAIGSGELSDLISDGLKVVKWIKSNDKRFFGNVVKFNF